MNPYLAGLIAGCLATFPMTSLMVLLWRGLPTHERYPLPPRQISMKLAGEAGVREHLDEPERKAVTLVAHFAYGAVMGFIYSLVAHHLPGLPVLKGMLFGLVVWSGSYLLLLPALGILRSAVHHPMRRNGLMISAHLVWGAVLGLLVNWFVRF